MIARAKRADPIRGFVYRCFLVPQIRHRPNRSASGRSTMRIAASSPSSASGIRNRSRPRRPCARSAPPHRLGYRSQSRVTRASSRSPRAFCPTPHRRQTLPPLGPERLLELSGVAGPMRCSVTCRCSGRGSGGMLKGRSLNRSIVRTDECTSVTLPSLSIAMRTVPLPA